MVAERDQRAHAHVLGRAALEDLVADERVAAHHRALGIAQTSRLEQDLVRNADLADVVQRRRQLDGLGLVALQPDRVGNEARVARHAHQVIARFLVAELARARQAHERLLLPVAHLARGVVDHGFQQAPPVLQRQLLPAQRQQVAAARHAFARVHRLDEEVGDAGVERVVAHLAIVVRRHHHDRHVLVAGQRAQALGELDAVHVRHHVVDQHEVGDVARRPHHGIDGAPEPRHRHALVERAHHLLENGAAGGLVVHHHRGVARHRKHVNRRLRHAPPLVDSPREAYPGDPRLSS